MNWSMITWAPLAKSPNCASQMTRLRGSAELKPYSKPSTAASDSMRVDDQEPALLLGEVLQRHPARGGAAIVQHGVAMAEGAAAGVLPGEAHVGALEQQRAERQHLGAGPVDAGAVAHHLGALVVEPAQLGVGVEPLGELARRVGDALQRLARHRGRARSSPSPPR